ncbi:MAG: beta-propeller fold lactonase family protein [Spirochaetales bacterium]|nr:beta-propeller fold lactonase family protein [Spirochaetales bacterium]
MKRNYFSLICCVFLLCTTLLYSQEKWIRVLLRVFPENYALNINGEVLVPEYSEGEKDFYKLPAGLTTVVLSAEGYKNLSFETEILEGSVIEEKLEPLDSRIHLITEIATGGRPKSVAFTPDGRYFLSALLGDTGVDVFKTWDFTYWGRIQFPENIADRVGFVEIAFAPERREILVSQMTTNMVHIIDLDDFAYITSIETGGIGSKVIILSGNEEKAYVSNWWSNNISVIDMDERKVLHKIKVEGIPRGLALSPDNNLLYVCLYDTGNIQVIDLQSNRVYVTIHLGPGAKRHAITDPRRGRLYVSDMFWGDVFVLNLENYQLLKRVHIGQKLNTIQLTPDGKYLFVSSRGRNNSETYLKEGPEFGKVFVIDTETMEIIDWVWGRDQPTGLDISPDGRLMVFSDFRDDNLEVYHISRLLEWKWGTEQESRRGKKLFQLMP